MRLLPVVVALLLAGCIGSAPSSPGDPEPSSTGTDHDGGHAPPQEGEPGEPEPKPAPPGESETWYLHDDPRCGDERCNCGRHDYFMDRTDSQGDCGGGQRFASVLVEWDDCKSACFPAREPMAAFPAGSLVEGIIYITTDYKDEVDVYVSLANATRELGSAEVHDVPVDGMAGFRHTPVPFAFELEHPVGNEGLRFILGVRADVSYFVGKDDDHASRFQVSLPVGA